jgi:hypothetical protein
VKMFRQLGAQTAYSKAQHKSRKGDDFYSTNWPAVNF